MPPVRTRITFTIVLLVVVILLGTQVSELFDTWDNTLETGNDIEFNLTVVALCVGACVLLARLLLRDFGNSTSAIHVFLSQQVLLISNCWREVRRNLLSSSLPPLRV
jgi:hypothetical protein